MIIKSTQQLKSSARFPLCKEKLHILSDAVSPTHFWDINLGSLNQPRHRKRQLLIQANYRLTSATFNLNWTRVFSIVLSFLSFGRFSQSSLQAVLHDVSLMQSGTGWAPQGKKGHQIKTCGTSDVVILQTTTPSLELGICYHLLYSSHISLHSFTNREIWQGSLAAEHKAGNMLWKQILYAKTLSATGLSLIIARVV